MQRNIEKEYKVLVSEEQFRKMLKLYPDHIINDQTNYYYDTSPSLKNRNIAVRIRKLNNKYIFTLKHFNRNYELEEYEVEIKNPDINDSKVREILEKFEIDNLKQIGKLHTVRHLYKDKYGELCIDANEYNNKSDYEIEYELYEPGEDHLERFKRMLAEADIEYKENKISKIARMMNTLKEVEQ